MDILIYVVLPWTASIAITVYMVYGMYQMTDHREKAVKIKWWLTILPVIGIQLTAFWHNPVINVLAFLLLALVCYRTFQGSRVCLLHYLALTASVLLTDVIANYIYALLWNKGILYLNSDELNFILLVACIRLAESVVIRLMVLVVNKHEGHYINSRQLVISIVMPGFSILNLYTLLYFQQFFLSNTMLLLCLINLVILIGLNIYLIVTIDDASEKNRLESERNLYRQQVLMQYRYYEQEEAKYEESRKLIHDIRNHIQAMEELYQEDAAGHAREYAGGIRHILDSLGQKYYTSHQLLNIILNDKARLMQKHGIREDIKIGEVDFKFMRDVDMTAIFANLLDNAVEAACGCGNAYIRLRVSQVHGFVSVIMENTCGAEPVKTRSGFLSGKKEHTGLGLKNVHRAVENYGGDMQLEWKDGMFYTNIMLVQ